MIDRLRSIDDLNAHLANLVEQCAKHVRTANDRKEQIETLIREKALAFPWLADAFAEFDHLCEQRLADVLERKVHPARSAAKRIRELSLEKRAWQKRARIARHRVRFYEGLFPWLRDLVQEDIDALLAATAEQPDREHEEDPVARYLAPGEYKNLDVVERNQRALDRYRASRKRSWEVGRDYERYVGYLYEQQGFQVEYKGAQDGLADLGRDLIAKRHDGTLIIQCKNWSEHRVIHEKHVFQLFGTTIEYWLKDQEHIAGEGEPTLFDTALEQGRAHGVLVTTSRLSDEARQYASRLRIQVHERLQFDRAYPCIKCNISRTDRTRIYHLPMDQQYDNVVIEPERGECYVSTVREAHELGFRRAWRWRDRK